MSSNRSISPLAVEALRSLTAPLKVTIQDTKQPSPDRDTNAACTGSSAAAADGAKTCRKTNDIGARNVELCIENQKLRKCLTLMMDNSDLKTMNLLSSVMSMCDDKLRNYIEDKILESSANFTTTIVNATSDQPSSSSAQTTSSVQTSSAQKSSAPQTSYAQTTSSAPQTSYAQTTSSAPQTSFAQTSSAQAFDQRNVETVGSNSYGKSFQEIDLDELRESTSQASSSKAPSPRRGYSPIQSSGSIRPPMRFGVGKSPYHSQTRTYPTEVYSTAKTDRQFSNNHDRSFAGTVPGYNSVSQGGDPLTISMLSDSGNTSPRSSSPRKRISFNIPEFTISKESAFSPFKRETTTTAMGNDKSEQYSPRYSHDKPQPTIMKQKTPPVSSYQIAQHSLYDSSAKQNGGEIEKRPKVSPVSKERIVTRKISRSARFTEASEDHNVKCLYTEAVRLDEEFQAGANGPFEQSTQTSHATNSVGTDKHILRNNSVQQSLQTAGRDVDGFDKLGMPQAASTPIASRKKDSTIGSGNRPKVPPYESVEASRKHQLAGNSTFGRTITTVNTTGSPVDLPIATSTQRENTVSSELLASIIGINGRGSAERAKYIINRPVDILIGYSPDISDETARLLARSTPNKRLAGEVAFQLDRRILEFVFARINDKQHGKRSRYYGYSVASIMLLIAKEVRGANNDIELDVNLRMRLEHMVESLQRLGYDIERHAEFTQDVVNKYGLLNGTPDRGTAEELGIREPAVIRVLLGQLIQDEQELDDMLIILDCLHYLAYYDKGPLFIW